MPASGAVGRLCRAGMLAVAAVLVSACLLPAIATAQHSKLALESLGPGGGNGGQSARLVGGADVEKRAIISTAEPLVAADTDASTDIYEHSGSGTTLLSAGAAGGNGPFPANFATSASGGRIVMFQTDERLSAADTDDSLDIYRSEGGPAALASFGPAGGNGPHDAFLVAASQNGNRFFIATREALLASDTDSSIDIYQRSGGVVTLISTGPSGGGGVPSVELADISDDGHRVFFVTTESLVPEDTDSKQDVYERFDGATTLVSTGPNGGNAAIPAQYGAISADGSRAFFTTSESLVAADTDDELDVYERSGGTTVIHSIGPSGGNGNPGAGLMGVSSTGTRVFVQTAERLDTVTDRDSQADVYQSMGGAVTLLTPGKNDFNGAVHSHFAGASTDGTRVFFRTAEALVASDTERYQDIYMVEGGVVSLLSTGPAGGNGAAHAYFAGASDDGTHVFFQTNEPLVGTDTDSSTDVYERYGGVTSVLSTGPSGGNGPYDATFAGVSGDGTRAFFSTSEALGSVDTDQTADVYSANVPGTLTVSVDAMPDHPQDFGFSAVGLEQGGFNFGPLGFGPTTFQLDDDLDPVLTDAEIFTQVTPGTGYSVSQATPPGWDLAAATCDDGSPVGNIDISAAEEVTCTFTNHKRGKVEVLLDAVPNDAQDFSFTAGGGLSPTAFSLDDDADGTLPSAFTIGDVPAGSGYSLAQSLPSGWDQASATCSDGSPVGNISVSPDETVTCTFTNRKRGQVVVVEDSLPNDPQDFSFTAGGGLSPTAFSLDDDADGTLSNTQTFADVVPGAGYSVSQTVPSGWSQSSAICSDGSPVSNIDVSPGEVVTCTFVNTKRGRIVVVKDARPDDPQDFSFTAGGGLSPATFSLDDDSDPALSNTRTYSDLAPASGYSLAESVPSGWDQASATCNDGSPVSNISVSAGEVVTCTFVNTKRGQITIVKDSVPNNQQDFSFTAGGGLSPTSFQLDDDTNNTLSNTRTFTSVVARDGYSVSETVPNGWHQASASCSNGSPVSNIAVGPGESVTCTFVNHRDGSLTIVKDAVPNDPQDFSFNTSGGLSPSSFQLDDDNNGTLANTRTYSSVQSGTYSVTETVPAGWDQTSATCSNGNSPSSITISANESVTCTFTNRKRGRVIALLDAQPDDAQDFSFTAGGGLTPTTFSLDDDADPALLSSRTFSDVVPGSGYSVAAGAVPAAWVLSGSSCDDGSPASNIDVTAGETVTCTFTIQKRGQIVLAKNAVPDDAQDFSFTAGGGLSPGSVQLDDDSDPALANTHTFANVAPGSGYSLSETVPAGWDQTAATCDDGSGVSNINVGPAEIVTCTFTNRKRGRVVVTKAATPQNPQDFSFTAGGGLSPTSFSLDDDSDPGLSNTRTFDNVVPGSGYSLSETVPAGWDQTAAACDDGSPVSNIDVAAGETVSCSFSNRQRARLVVVKNALPDDPQDFSFTAGGGLSPAGFSLDDDSDPALSDTRTFSDVVPGSGYTLSEELPSGWDQASASCDDGSSVSDITLSAGEVVTCTFTNRKRGRVVAVKNSIPDDPQDFSFTAGGGLVPASFSLDDDSDGTLASSRTFSDVVPGGGYSLSESVPSGWDQTGATCDDGSPPSNIDVAAGETVTCTFTNRKRGRIVVVHDAVPNDAQDFSFTAGGGLVPATFSLDDDLDPALSSTRTFNDVPVGSGYSISEAVPAGWDLAGTICDDGSPVSNIDVSIGETVTCTFTNQKRGRVVVVKDAQPNDAQDFSFTAGGGLSPTGFQLDDDSDPALSNTRTFDDVPVGGGYSVSETLPAGWIQSSATCDDGSPVSNIAVSPGEIVTCTFVNTKRGRIVAVKDAQPNDAQDFSFTAGGGLSPSSFSLDDDSDPALSNSQTFNDVTPGNGYSLTETVPSGWDQTGAACDDGSPVSNIDVAAGETVTCTFTNRKRGRIVVVKDAQPSDAQDFSFTAGGGLSPATFELDDDSDPALPDTHTFSDVVPGSGYSVSETVPSGWDQAAATCDDGSPVSNIAVAAGETVTCTFTNHRRGRIVAVKKALPTDAQDFSFTAGGGLSPASFSLDDDADPALPDTRTFDDVPAGGGYSLSEAVPAGWDQVSATCDDASPVGDIAVAPGETVTCTFTNRKRGQISISKNAIPDDAQDFSFSAGGGLSPASFSLDDDLDPGLPSTRVFANVPPGSGYSVAETLPPGWEQTSVTCDDGSPVTDISVSAGEHVSCTFTNTKQGAIVVVKDAAPNDPQDFTFTAGGGLSPASFQLDEDSDPALSNTRMFANVAPGSSYSISETVPAGWDQTAAACDDGSSPSNVDVSPGEVVTCTFSNRKRARIVVVKDATPSDPQDFSFTAGGGLSPATFELDDDSDPALPDRRTFDDLVPGSGYSISEDVPSGWDQTSAACDDGSPPSNVDVAAGETVTCTFSNRKRGSLVVREDAVPDGAQDFSFTAGGGLSPASFELDDDSDPALSNSRNFDDLVPASGYSISQTAPSGWDLDSVTCDDGSPASDIDVAPGERVTCTFVHHQHGSVTVTKQAQPADPQDFSFTAGGGLSPTSFSLDDDSDPALPNARTFDGVSAGSGYSLQETVPAGWAQVSATCDDGSAVSNIGVAPGEHVTCTFTNRKHGKIVVRKDATPDDAQDFSFTAGGGLSPASFQLDDDSDPALSNTRTFDGVAPGSGYSVAESVPPGWSQTGATCDDGSSPDAIDVSAGETVTCTFANRRNGRIVVVKDATPDDPQDFSFTAGGGLSPASFQLDDDSDPALSNTRTFDEVAPGSGYSVAEALPVGWAQASATCDDGSAPQNIGVSSGETVTCTFLNTRGYARPRSASPARYALVPSYGECTSPNRDHGPGLAFPSCNPPAGTSPHLTVGTPDANTRAANMTGSIRFQAELGNPSTPVDEADLTLQISVTDVRIKADTNDYTGELEARLGLRITDRLNGPGQNEGATVTDAPFTFAVPCAATGGTTNIGASCILNTTADAIMPGVVVETKRSIWELAQIEFLDGGPDGLASTQDNAPFLRQGIFIP